MTDQPRVVHVHRTKVIRKRRWFGWKVGLGKAAVYGIVILWVVNEYVPGFNMPLIPGVACGPMVQAEAPGGIAGVAYTGGRVVNALQSGPPEVADVQAALSAVAEDAGTAVGSFLNAVRGEIPEPVTPIPEDTDLDDGTVTIGDTSCACPGAAVPVSGTGAELAARAALAAGFLGDGAVMAVAVAKAESGYRSVRSPLNSNGTYDHGLWQINSVHADLLASHDWRDPLDNARMAYTISDGGTDWSPWTTYDNGTYLPYLNEARAAVEAVDGTTVAAAYTPQAGLQPEAQRAEAFIRSEFGFTGTIGGYSHRYIAGTNTLSEHAKGLALDVIVTGDLADRIADYFAGPGREAFGVNNVIWNRRITNAGRGWEWGTYTGASPHTDHVHIDFHDGGGTGTTPAAVDCDEGTIPAAYSAGGASVITANVPFTIGEAAYRARVIGLLEQRPGILMVQEATDRNVAAYARDAEGSWGVVQFTGEGKAGSPIVYDRDRFELAASGVRLGFRGHRYDRWLTWAVLRSADGDLAVVNTHLPTRAYDRPGEPYRRAQTAALGDLVGDLRRAGYPVVVGADWNTNLRDMTELRAMDLTTNWHAGTPCDRTSIHGGRIDGLAFTGLAVTTQGCLERGPSDHYPVWAALEPTRGVTS